MLGLSSADHRANPPWLVLHVRTLMSASERNSRATRFGHVLVFPPFLLFPSFRRRAPVIRTRRPALLLDHNPANAARQPYDRVHPRGHDARQHAADPRRLARERTRTRPMSWWTQTARIWARRSDRAPGSSRRGAAAAAAAACLSSSPTAARHSSPFAAGRATDVGAIRSVSAIAEKTGADPQATTTSADAEPASATVQRAPMRPFQLICGQQDAEHGGADEDEYTLAAGMVVDGETHGTPRAPSAVRERSGPRLRSRCMSS
jgi:hypothetical protein